MTLTAGTRLGNYEIVAPLGSGGMGEVYRARDVRLGRSVAIKALPAAFARDPDRLARFEREARVLASVQHSGIAVLYGIEDGDGTSYLAIELVEGETLAQRLARAPLSPTETLDVGAQIASALDAAHEQGIVHRDLKPGNVMVNGSGVVKVLDFGLAKAGPAASDSSVDLSASPTVAFGATAAGIVLGTASYMSPEQARGRSVDRRTDVWALGCILFECLTGRQAFAGETISDVIARVLEREPEWSLLPAGVPSRLRDLMRRCLTKNPAERPRDAGDLRGELLAIANDLSSPGRTAAASGTPSLAVLYFQNHSTEPESDFFCDGITEDILTDLSKVKALRVASRNAVARYRGQSADVAKVAAELGVNAVLEGSVRRAGPRVRITVQLVSADGFQLWGERYDRTIDDVFTVQEEIASSIASALKVALTRAETENLGQDRPKDVRAYELYLKGRDQYRHYTEESIDAAIRLFEQAIAVDPSYALAYAGIGDGYGQLLQWSDRPPAELIQRGLEAARRAIALNPKLPEAHKAEALVLGFAGERHAAVESLKRAIQVDPRFTPALGNLAAEWFREANLAGAERLIRRSLELEPDDHHTLIWLGFVMTWTNRLDETLELCDRVRRMSDDPFYVTISHIVRATVWSLRHQPREIERGLEAARADGADAANLAMIEAYLSTRKDVSERARRLLAEHGDSTRLNFSALAFGAMAAFRLGDPDRAVDFMRRRLIVDAAPTIMRLDPMLHPLLDLPAFAPRRAGYDLVWPVEAPMIDPALLRLFRSVRIESGTPEGSAVLAME
jgi:serine/threonine protein kinase/tetratricopeptide (TPR) repeat protein